MKTNLKEQIQRIKHLNENMGLPGIDDKNGFKVPAEVKQETDEQQKRRPGYRGTDDDQWNNTHDDFRSDGVNAKPNPRVTQLQNQLKSLGYDIGVKGVDGIYSNDLSAAIRKFQVDNGLVAKGLYDTKTKWAVIKKIRAKGLNENFGLPGIDDKNGFKVPKEAKETKEEELDESMFGLYAAQIDKALEDALEPFNLDNSDKINVLQFRIEQLETEEGKLDGGYKMPGFDETMDNLDKLTIRREEGLKDPILDKHPEEQDEEEELGEFQDYNVC